MNVVITGATKGIGRAIAEKFANSGSIIFGCSRNSEELAQMRHDFEVQSPQSSFKGHVVDVGDKEQVKAFAKWIFDSTNEIDVLVNNAGYYAPGPILDEEDGLLENMMAVNLFSAYHLTRNLLPAMLKRNIGHIFNICSAASIRTYDNGGSYGITKFALMGFSKNLREQMKDTNIKVTAVYPGATMSSSWKGTGVDPQRIMEASDIAQMIFAAAHLSSQATVEDIVIRPQKGDV